MGCGGEVAVEVGDLRGWSCRPIAQPERRFAAPASPPYCGRGLPGPLSLEQKRQFRPLLGGLRVARTRQAADAYGRGGCVHPRTSGAGGGGSLPAGERCRRMRPWARRRPAASAGPWAAPAPRGQRREHRPDARPPARHGAVAGAVMSVMVAGQAAGPQQCTRSGTPRYQPSTSRT